MKFRSRRNERRHCSSGAGLRDSSANDMEIVTCVLEGALEHKQSHCPQRIKKEGRC
jgi:redox-sensitive bicupin YhaK (pirin superfamily)